MMSNLFNDLPVELVGTNVLEMLGIKDIVMLERACGSKKSHQHFMNIIPYCPPVVLPLKKHDNISLFEWFAKKRCKLKSLWLLFPFNSSAIHEKNLKVEELLLYFESTATMEDCKVLLDNSLGHIARSITINRDQNKKVIEKLSTCTVNLDKLYILCANNITYWLTVEILSR